MQDSRILSVNPGTDTPNDEPEPSTHAANLNTPDAPKRPTAQGNSGSTSASAYPTMKGERLIASDAISTGWHDIMYIIGAT